MVTCNKNNRGMERKLDGNTKFEACLIDKVFKNLLDERTDMERKAAEATREYISIWFNGWIETFENPNDHDVTVYDIEQRSYVFNDGYLAALSGVVKVR